MSNPASPPASPASGAPVAFTSYQKFMIAILAFLQFTIVLDFMIMAPLGAMLMKDLHIPAARFGLVVSVYAFAAGTAGLLAAGFADRFDRKRLLLFFYSGFVAGTLFCGLAPNYQTLLVARMITGLFGGVIGSISFAIIADLFPLQVRGRVMGFVQTAFAVSQSMGIPLGLLLSNRWGWHAPFLMIVGFSSVVGVIIALRVRPIVGHLALQREGNAFRKLADTLSRGWYLRAYACTMLLVTGGFMLMPFASAYTVNNMGIPLDHLWPIYMVTGFSTMLLGPVLGKLSDSLGKFKVFAGGSVLSMIMVVTYTHLGVTPIGLVILVNVILMTGITSRIISAAALTSAVPEARDRGAFMAINSSVQQMAGGVASAVAGLIVTQTPSGSLVHYDTLGYCVVVAMVLAMVQLYGINRALTRKLAAAAPPARASTAA
jgi:predicted MFS family arabinose efflux permease